MNLPSVGVPWLGLAAWLGVSMASSLVDSTENLSRLTAVFAELAPLPPCNSVWVDSFITSKVQAAIGLHRAPISHQVSRSSLCTAQLCYCYNRYLQRLTANIQSSPEDSLLCIGIHDYILNNVIICYLKM